MKFLDKFALKIFSIIILVTSMIFILVVADIIPATYITGKMTLLMNHVDIKIIIGIAMVLIIFALKGLFFTSQPTNTGKEGIILENTSGKLVISKESLENMIASVAKEIPGTEFISSKTILDKNKNLIVYVTTVVSRDVMLKDISAELQDKIKEAMRKTADLEVKEVNIRIKNITSKKVKGLPSPENKLETVNTKEEQEEKNQTEEA